MSDDKRTINRVSVAPAIQFLQKTIPQSRYVKTCVACGSWRRGLESINDVDLILQVVKGKGKQAGEDLRSLLKLEGTKRKGGKYFDGLFAGGIWLNCWMYDDPKSTGAMLLFATGSGGYNNWMRARAKSMGFKLNRYGLFHLTPSGGEIQVAGEKEEGIFEKLGVGFAPPKDRSVTRPSSQYETGNPKVADLLFKIGKEYEERSGKTKPGYHASNKYRSKAFLDASKVAAVLDPKDWEESMGEKTYADALILLEKGRCDRMDELGLGM